MPLSQTPNPNPNPRTYRCQACLLMHPVVCTMLLRVFDCRNVEEDDGLWLRADLSIECFSVHHQGYRVNPVMTARLRSYWLYS